ncbi:class I SAM-dependent methyltransferase [Anabaena sphaerica FACHB-251]|uniref:Class I SAM-dependent methyltransferase n=1 Tax=Anabaena sphaerica FACHB-251 TaxID=2692883 RepID=A0A926WJR2_9NOST|nr:class I SAM-dependent methyltransferase [Anabaena sphaerica]MBD2294686.1 class I SAM-dependent methyltransferase [Anabaena sphaerica FACHB-251]
MAEHYDSIAQEYKKAKELPIRLHIERYTYFNMLGDITGKSILDLACGEGLYTRQFKQKGASLVVGVDISEKMLELARQEEAKNQLDIQYIVGNVMELGKIGDFDLVVASYLLNYAQTEEQLQKMCQTIFTNLKPGGRFVTLNNNSEQSPISYLKTEKYGFIKTITEPLQPGTAIKLIFSVADKQFSFDNYYLSKDTYKKVLEKVGFKDIRWQKMLVSPEGIKEFSQEFWQDYLDCMPHFGIECFKY